MQSELGLWASHFDSARPDASVAFLDHSLKIFAGMMPGTMLHQISPMAGVLVVFLLTLLATASSSAWREYLLVVRNGASARAFDAGGGRFMHSCRLSAEIAVYP